MNYAQFEGILRIAVAGFVTFAANKGWIPMIDKETFTADLVSLIAIGGAAIWSHVRHATVAAAIAAFMAISFSPNISHATDVAAKAASTPATPVCTQAMCSGWYAFAGVGGTGTNMDILGSGLSGSVFANGAEMMTGGGYQYWNGKFFLAVEAGGGYLIPAGGVATPANDRWQGETLLKAGYGLQGLFSTSATPTTFDQLAANVMSPYAIIGARYKQFGSGFASGAGLQYSLGGNWTTSVEYLHVNYNGAMDNGTPVNTDNSVRLRFEKHF